MNWLVVALVGVLALFALVHLRGGRRRTRVLAGRVPGIIEFAKSLSRGRDDPTVRAVYEAVLHEIGPEAAAVRGDGDLGSLWGVVDEDLDDLVLDAVARLPEGKRCDLRGTFALVSTPRQVIELIESRSGPA
jgi:hypothetical protein